MTFAKCESPVQVRRYVYQDVVRLADIAPYFCPSQIQAYVINGAEVVFLRPRPSSKVPDKQDEKIEPCRACGRHCRAPTTFCSLTCKVGATVMCWVPACQQESSARLGW